MRETGERTLCQETASVDRIKKKLRYGITVYRSMPCKGPFHSPRILVSAWSNHQPVYVIGAAPLDGGVGPATPEGSRS